MDKKIYDLGKPYSTDVYHYTKLSNLFSIITKDGIVFHAGRFDTMNDPNDSVLITNMENERRCQSFECDTFGEFGTGEVMPFLISFSCDCDKAVMWRLYNADVCLHINPQSIYNFCKTKGCQYPRMDKVSYVENMEDNPDCRNIMQSLSSCVAHGHAEYEAEVRFSFCKHKDFFVENEWRLACFDKDEICSDVKIKGFKYNTPSYYREIYLPKECLTGITILTYNDEAFSQLSYQIEDMLNKYHYSSIEIRKTKTAEFR